MKGEKHIALMAKNFLAWGGGIDFLRNCTSALLQKERDRPTGISVLVPDKTVKGELVDSLYPFKKLLADVVSFRIPQYKRRKPFAKEILLDSFDKEDNNLAVVRYRDNRNGLTACLEQIGADIIFPLMESPGTRFPFPWLGYIPDLQHKMFPHNFTRNECADRDRIFGNLLTDASAVIVNSHAVQADIEKYYPNFRCRIFPLPFSPVPLRNWFDDDPSEYRRKYHLPDCYFLISNQFWVHKSHITAFEALYGLMKTSPPPDVHIVCTGETGDYRFPKYFSELKNRIDAMNLSERIRFLGYIPKKDQLQLLRGAMALLQPTLFEGGPGGGAVYDAVALGVPSIVSDIPVNREILEENVYFFQAGSADALKEKMLALYLADMQRPSPEVLLEAGRRRAEKLGNALDEALDYAMTHASCAS